MASLGDIIERSEMGKYRTLQQLRFDFDQLMINYQLFAKADPDGGLDFSTHSIQESFRAAYADATIKFPRSTMIHTAAFIPLPVQPSNSFDEAGYLSALKQIRREFACFVSDNCVVFLCAELSWVYGVKALLVLAGPSHWYMLPFQKPPKRTRLHKRSIHH